MENKAQELAPIKAATANQRAVESFLADNFKVLKSLMPEGCTPEKAFRIACMQFREIPALDKATPSSVIAGIISSFECGLQLGSSLGEAYLIPFYDSKKKITVAQFVIGVPGRMKLAYQHPITSSVNCGTIFEPQLEGFYYNEAMSEIVVPMHDKKTNYRGLQGIYFYAVVKTTRNGTILRVFNRPTIEARRAKLKSKDSPAWKDHYNEMAMNMTLRHVLKMVPRSTQMVRAEFLEDQISREIPTQEGLTEGDFK